MALSRLGVFALSLVAIVACATCGSGGGDGDGGGGGGAGDDGGDDTGNDDVPTVPLTVLVRWREGAPAAGYRVHWGTAPTSYTHAIDVANPTFDVVSPSIDVAGDASAVVELSTVVELGDEASTFYVAVAALDDDGQSSAFSNEIVVSSP